MEKYKICLQPIGKTLEVNKNTPLIDLLHGYGIEFPCGGKGTCGKCRVKITEGSIETSETHRQKLEQLQLGDEWRLACFSRCSGNLTIEIEQLEQIILADETEFSFSPQHGFGIAVDLGTTTIVAQLVDLSTAKVMAVETALNPQAKFGADLISRIQACLDGNQPVMTGLIRKTIGGMCAKMLDGRKFQIRKVVLVGNAAMQLIFSGGNVAPLACYPFHTDDLGMKLFIPEELGWHFPVSEEIQFYPSIGSFVGSDILAGIAATGLHKKENYTALIDLGTNGEIVLGNKNRIVCASTAAGPAFEGANISMGMRAVNGAISSLILENNEPKATVIGNVPAKGICGSGLIDAVAILRKQNLIGEFGEICSGDTSVFIAPKVLLTQKDINEFQLAKAAIAAGFTILAKSMGIGLSDISEIYIAGGFGNYINIDNLIATGMVNGTSDNIHKMGNTALIGAKTFLFSGEEEASLILSKTSHVNLEGDPEFQDIFIENMMFG
ncbi:MAG: ASKHA domain-containing protein [Prolixibacteraceae bacterium]|jgi:uncharacterized 2Fe-2S/4Fe-4S cluster protein (DUF4445 family)|nr:ASKHA domain-containing protein [Prolixibacteraceae bacterium]